MPKKVPKNDLKRYLKVKVCQGCFIYIYIYI